MVYRAIALKNVPVLCLDTCSIVDIMRDPTRDDMKPQHGQAALDVIAAAEEGKIVCLMAQQVQLEFDVHDLPQRDETTKAIDRLRKRALRANEFSAIFGGLGELAFDHIGDYTQRARAVVERLLQVSIPVQPRADVHAKAFARVNKARAPARRGKDSSKDCLVYETYLEAVSALRVDGLSAAAVLVSSNTAEYQVDSQVHPDIDLEFKPLALSYQPNMAAAKHAIGLNRKS